MLLQVTSVERKTIILNVFDNTKVKIFFKTTSIRRNVMLYCLPIKSLFKTNFHAFIDAKENFLSTKKMSALIILSVSFFVGLGYGCPVPPGRWPVPPKLMTGFANLVMIC